MPQFLVVADDLSGAVETVAAMGFRGARVWLHPHKFSNHQDAPVQENLVAIDANSRVQSQLAASTNLKSITAEISRQAESHSVFFKIDSLLRGHVRDTVDIARAAGPVILVPALPSQRRMTINGSVVIDGVNLKDSEIWKFESGSATATIAETLHGIDAVNINLGEVRGDSLSELVHQAAANGEVAICDAISDEDLNRIIRASKDLDDVQFVGASALARAIGQIVFGDKNHDSTPASNDAVLASLISDQNQPEIMVVVGSTSKAAKQQLEALRANQSARVFSSEQLTKALSPELVSQARQSSLVLTGGETARRVLDALGVHWVQPLAELEPGVVVCATDQHQLVVIKPGSFGNDQTLVRAVSFLKNRKIQNVDEFN